MDGAARARERARFRVPLHFKVMVSYLVVVGLVLFPTLFYLRTYVQRSLIHTSERVMNDELSALAERLGRTSEADLSEVLRVVVAAMPQRVTVVDPQGTVLADSAGERASESHAGRPEIQAALAEGQGRAVRRSATLGDERLYVARRFPLEGPPRGVIRLSVPTAGLKEAGSDSYRFTEKAGALGLSAAVLLSFVAALVVSRPLRRLTDAVRAYGQGDLGHPVAVDSVDELGELADALRELAARLAEPLAAAGADRAALATLVEELPMGVVVFEAAHRAPVVSARARELLELPLAEDAAKLADWPSAPEHAEAIALARAEDRAVTTTLLGPGKRRGEELELRWIALPGGSRVVALVTDRRAAVRVAELEELLRESSRLLRRAAQGGDAELAARLEAAADAADRAVLGRRPTVEQLETREVGALCASALEEVRARASARGVRLHLELDEPASRVVEAEGRAQQALRRLLDAMISEAQPNAEVRVESEVGPKQVRITARTPEGRKVKTKPIAEIIHCLGGDAGSKHTGEASEAWVKIPRG